MSGPYRILGAQQGRFGALIDLSEPVGFRLGSTVHNGYYGDTLASALLASGVSSLATSPLLGRPRGPMGLAVDDPTILLVEENGAWRPAPAGDVVLREGLRARSADAPSAALRRFAPASAPDERSLPLARRALEKLRRALPLPAPSLPKLQKPGATRFERCDALVIGAGLAGLSAALALRSAGFDVRVVEASSRPGGIADLYDGRIDATPIVEWAASKAEALAERGLLSLGATAVSIDPDGAVAVIDRSAGRAGSPPELRLISAGAVVLATGFRERPMAFSDNDRPGVFFAVAARALLRRHAVAPGRRVLVATSCDEGYRTAMDLREAGVAVDFVIDRRDAPEGPAVEMAKALGAPVSLSSLVTGLELDRKSGALAGVRVRNRHGEGASAAARVLPAEALVASGGFAPRDELIRGLGLAAENGLHFAMRGPNAVDAVAGGWQAGVAAAAQLGGAVTMEAPVVEVTADEFGEAPELASASFATPGAGPAFVDIGADVTIDDLARAVARYGDAPAAIARRLGLGSGADGGRLSADLPSLAFAERGVDASGAAAVTPGRATLAQRAAQAGLREAG